MSIILKDIILPRHCKDCVFFENNNCYFKCLVDFEKRPKGCPIVSFSQYNSYFCKKCPNREKETCPIILDREIAPF